MKKNIFLIFSLLITQYTFIQSFDDTFDNAPEQDITSFNSSTTEKTPAADVPAQKPEIKKYTDYQTDAGMKKTIEDIQIQLARVKTQEAKEDLLTDIFFENNETLVEKILIADSWSAAMKNAVYRSPKQHEEDIKALCKGTIAQKKFLSSRSGQEKIKERKNFWEAVKNIPKFYRKFANRMTRADCLYFARGAETPADLAQWLQQRGKDETKRIDNPFADPEKRAIIKTMFDDALRNAKQGNTDLLKLFQAKDLKLPLTETQKANLEEALKAQQAAEARQRGGWTSGTQGDRTKPRGEEGKGEGKASTRGNGWTKAARG